MASVRAGHRLLSRYLVAAAAALLCCTFRADHAVAQRFNQTIGFGDSTLDSGWYRNSATPPNSTNATFNADFATAVAQGAGKPTTSPGLMSIEVLANYWGLAANPANQPGGTNYATGDAMNRLPTTSGNQNAVPTATQIGNYLAATGGAANPNALYVISSGGNDALQAGATATSTTLAASDLVAAVGRLRDAGARYIIVPNLFASAEILTAPQRALLATYNSALWSGLAATGINFIPADINSVLVAVRGNAAFGFTASGPACTQPAGIASGWALLCSRASSISTLVTPDAAQTHLFADNLHLSSAGQRIIADYEYSLLVAPSMISMMAEAPVKTRATVIGMIDNQIPISQRHRRAASSNGWVGGDVGSLKIVNAPGFPEDPGTPVSMTAGLDHSFPNGWLIGVAVSAGTQKAQFTNNFGSFRQDEFAVSGYAAQYFGPVWLRLIGSYGTIRYDINRNVPIGIAILPNSASATGNNLSVAVNAGIDLTYGPVTHGPIAGVTVQRVDVGAFTETGGFTALNFDSQRRTSTVSGLGYQFAIDAGQWRPFAKVAWNHEWMANDRLITASLTTVAAPSFSLPAVEIGKDWSSASVGTTLQVTDRVTALVAFIGQFAQRQLTTFGGQIGLNAAF